MCGAKSRRRSRASTSSSSQILSDVISDAEGAARTGRDQAVRRRISTRSRQYATRWRRRRKIEGIWRIFYGGISEPTAEMEMKVRSAEASAYWPHAAAGERLRSAARCWECPPARSASTTGRSPSACARRIPCGYDQLRLGALPDHGRRRTSRRRCRPLRGFFTKSRAQLHCARTSSR